jgi:hypothetical protein
LINLGILILIDIVEVSRVDSAGENPGERQDAPGREMGH